jgi:hypothetical protein
MIKGQLLNSHILLTFDQSHLTDGRCSLTFDRSHLLNGRRTFPIDQCHLSNRLGNSVPISIILPTNMIN